MKILVLNNGITFDVQTDFQKAREYFMSTLVKKYVPEGIIADYTFKNINIPFTLKEYLTRQGFNSATGLPDTIHLYGVDETVKNAIRTIVPEGLYDQVIFMWDMDIKMFPPGNKVITSWCNFNPLYQGTDFIQLSINAYFKQQDKVWKAATHESLHGFCYASNRKNIPVLDEMDNTVVNGQVVYGYKNDDPFALDGNYAHTLKNLQPFFAKTVKYKYFSQLEVDTYKLVPQLWQLLDRARELAGVPFVITSGFRTPQQNANAGGKPNSAHLRGLAVDLSCVDDSRRTLMTRGILNCGVPVFLEIAQKHIHIDIDASIHLMGKTIVSEDD